MAFGWESSAVKGSQRDVSWPKKSRSLAPRLGKHRKTSSGQLLESLPDFLLVDRWAWIKMFSIWSKHDPQVMKIIQVSFLSVFFPRSITSNCCYAFFDPCTVHLQKIWGSPNVQWSWSLYSDRRPCHTATSTFGVHCDVSPYASKFKFTELSVTIWLKKEDGVVCSWSCAEAVLFAIRLVPLQEIASLGLEREERQRHFLAPHSIQRNQWCFKLVVLNRLVLSYISLCFFGWVGPLFSAVPTFWGALYFFS